MTTDYQIKVKGQLDPKLAAWFGDFTISHTPNGDTLLTGKVIDQAALHGILARCRDLGLTLISINPSSNKETAMSQIHVESSKVIDARPEEIYGIFSDYRESHPAILPKYFTGLTVEKGGKGAGTVIQVTMKVLGVESTLHLIVSEPEPGRVLMETDDKAGIVTTFTVDPLKGGSQSHVTIATDFRAKAGFAGLMDKLMIPPITRHIYKAELQKVADYVRKGKLM